MECRYTDTSGLQAAGGVLAFSMLVPDKERYRDDFSVPASLGSLHLCSR
jgi:hypothetical protein